MLGHGAFTFRIARCAGLRCPVVEVGQLRNQPQPPPFPGGGGSFRGEALVPARGRHVTPQAMNNRRGWEDEASSRAVNAQPWEPPPGVVKLQCSDCHYWFAAPHHDVERCPDCEIREQRRAARAAALAEADRVLAEVPH
jgi:hypothetical protein